MSTFQTRRTARTVKPCDNYPPCSRGIQPGDRYLRAVATPWDDVNEGPRWWTLNICPECSPEDTP